MIFSLCTLLTLNPSKQKQLMAVNIYTSPIKLCRKKNCRKI